MPRYSKLVSTPGKIAAWGRSRGFRHPCRTNNIS
jgi:hypothetical protein